MKSEILMRRRDANLIQLSIREFERANPDELIIFALQITRPNEDLQFHYDLVKR